MYLMARHVFEDLGYRRYEWKCNAKNEPSPRAPLCGWDSRLKGIFRQHMVVKGQNRDTAWFAMLDSEWPARKARLRSVARSSQLRSGRLPVQITRGMGSCRIADFRYSSHRRMARCAAVIAAATSDRGVG